MVERDYHEINKIRNGFVVCQFCFTECKYKNIFLLFSNIFVKLDSWRESSRSWFVDASS